MSENQPPSENPDSEKPPETAGLMGMLKGVVGSEWLAVPSPESHEPLQIPPAPRATHELAPKPRAAACLKIRCPHCHNPIEVVEDDPSGDVSCPSCGSCFNLAKDVETGRFLDAGRKLGHFQLLDRLGQGAFGEVWKARDTELDRIVAIKIPRREHLTEQETEQFVREARAAAQVRHPNIVSVYEIGREHGMIYIASDFIEGATLSEWIEAHPLTVRESVELCATVAEALHHAHEAGVVHRDLKPQNILVRMDQRSIQARRASEGSNAPGSTDHSLARRACETLTPFITDFGLAKRDAGEITVTVEGAILGTPAYMSPEQARGDAHQADRRSDVYSLGVILFRLLTGELPFRGQRQMLIVQILNEEPPALRKLDARLPRDVETICLKCLEKEPTRRYPSATALAADLRRWLTGHPIEARPVSRTERAWRWGHRNPAVASLSATVVLVLLTGMAVSSFFASDAAARARQYFTAAETARREQDRADGNAKAANRNLYWAQMNLAQRDWENADIDQLIGRLQQTGPESMGGDDLRSFEWHYWNRQCRADLIELKGHSDEVSCVAYLAIRCRVAFRELHDPTRPRPIPSLLPERQRRHPVGRRGQAMLRGNVRRTVGSIRSLDRCGEFETVTRGLRVIVEASTLKSVMGRFRAARVLCVGDILLDRYIYGDVERISPEAPVPVLHVQREVEMLGGIGNVARNVVALSAHAEVLSVLGDDAVGRRTTELVGELNGCQTLPLVEAGRVSIEKTRCLTGRQQIVRLDREVVAPISDESMRELLRQYRALIGESTAVVISDYAKGVHRPDFLQSLIQIGREHDRPVIVDPKSRDYARYRGANILTPNRAELALATGLPVATPEQVIHASEELLASYGFQAVIATLGRDGMMVTQRGSAVGDNGLHFAELKATARDVFDVSGAGDTATSCLAVALSAGLPLIEAAELANAAAGLVVEKMGTAVVTTDELLHFCQMAQFRESDPKIKNWSEVSEVARQWRSRGFTVGFTNGCFDLLHPGHVQMLAQARRMCDRLIVGLNSDASVRRLKGPQRPVQNELARAVILGALACVDAVVLFEQDAPAELVEVIRPDVMIKGKDYRVEQIAGAAFVMSQGGRVELIDLVPEQSTTRLIAKGIA